MYVEKLRCPKCGHSWVKCPVCKHEWSPERLEPPHIRCPKCGVLLQVEEEIKSKEEYVEKWKGVGPFIRGLLTAAVKGAVAAEKILREEGDRLSRKQVKRLRKDIEQGKRAMIALREVDVNVRVYIDNPDSELLKYLEFIENLERTLKNALEAEKTLREKWDKLSREEIERYEELIEEGKMAIKILRKEGVKVRKYIDDPNSDLLKYIEYLESIEKEPE